MSHETVCQIADDMNLYETVRSLTMSKEKFIITADKVRAMFRYEIPYREVVPEGVEDLDVVYEKYYIQWEDLEALLSNLEEKNPTKVEFYENWGDPFKYHYFRNPDEMDDNAEDYYEEPSTHGEMAYFNLGLSAPRNQAEAIECIIRIIRPWRESDVDKYEPDCHCADYIDFEDIRESIRWFKEGEEVVAPYYWTDNTKAKYINNEVDYWYLLDTYEDEDVDFVRNMIDDLCRKGFPQGIAAKAISCYGGNRIYDCDYQFAKESYLWLLDLEGYRITPERRAKYANALGCIYYYGYCNDGVPEYDKALKYFTIGAASCRESVYMLAEMFRLGYGVEKNEPLALKMFLSVYNETKDLYLNSVYGTDFPDIAYMLGMMYEDDYLNYSNINYALKAYGYFLEAKEAVYRNSELESRIMYELEQLKPICECWKIEKMPVRSFEPDFLFELMKDSRTVRFEVEFLNENEIRISGRITYRTAPWYGSEYNEVRPYNDFLSPGKICIVLPEYGLCKTTNEATYRLKHVKKLWVLNDAKEFKANHLNLVVGDECDRYFFCRDDEYVACIEVERDEDIRWELMYDYRMPRE